MQPGVDYIGVSVGALIFNDKKEILLVKRSQKAKNERGCWEAPGGAVEFGETIEQAIRREIKEELGVDSIILKQYLDKDHLLTQEKQHWVVTIFGINIVTGQTAHIMEPEKFDDIGWFVLDNLPTPLLVVTSLDIEYYRKNQV